METFFARSRMLPLTLVSGGLACFEVAGHSGAHHDRHVTGGGKHSVKLPRLLRAACVTKPQSRQVIRAAEVGA